MKLQNEFRIILKGKQDPLSTNLVKRFTQECNISQFFKGDILYLFKFKMRIVKFNMRIVKLKKIRKFKVIILKVKQKYESSK